MFLFHPPSDRSCARWHYHSGSEIDGVLRLHCSFLNDLDRITGYDYVPTDGARHETYLGRRYISFDTLR